MNPNHVVTEYNGEIVHELSPHSQAYALAHQFGETHTQNSYSVDSIDHTLDLVMERQPRSVFPGFKRKRIVAIVQREDPDKRILTIMYNPFKVQEEDITSVQERLLKQRERSRRL